jgi:hypothetical protein
MRLGEYVAPPLGVRPQWSWNEQRMEDLLGAMARYAEAGMPANIEWVHELQNLVSEQRSRLFERERKL